MTLRRAGIFLLASAAPALATPTPTASPTPAPRLSGGFGRPRTTPAATANGGQTLADVVKAASETRQAKESRPPVEISNKTLVTDPNRGKLTTSRATPRPAAVPTRPSAAPASAEPTPGAAPAADAENAEETRWKETARRARQRVADARAEVARLEGEAKKLENDFYAWDDGLYRDNVIKPAWDKKREELDTARGELAAAEQDLADLPERARKAGALPGWIRE